MAYLDDENEGGPANPIGKVGMFLILFAVSLAVKYAWTGNIFGWKEEWTPARVDRELRNDRQGSELYRAISEAYPEEYQTFLSRMAEAARTGSRGATGAEASNFSRELMVSHFNGLARARADQLVEIARQYTALQALLQRTDVSFCARIFTGRVGPDTRPRPEAMAAMGHLGALQVRAARYGEQQPGAAPRPDMSEQEADVLRADVVRRSPEAARLMADERALMAATPAQQCAAGLVVYQAIEALPPELAARATVTMLRGSFGAPPAPANPTPTARPG